jgi:tetratricopeptide (TPR) repeat protein
MPKSPVAQIKSLPVVDEHWLVVIHRMRLWITPPNEPPSRPYGLFIFVLENGYALGSDLTPTAPTANDVQAALFKAMRKPPAASGPARRPAGITLVDENLAQELLPTLDEIGVQVAVMPGYPPEVDDIMREFEAHMNGSPEPPGLLSVKGVTPEFVAHLFVAAAEFHRAKPWVALSNEQTLAVRVPPERQPRYVSVMGNGGVEYGLSVCNKWADMQRLFENSDDPMEALPDKGVHSVMFNEITYVPFDDLDAVEQYGWEVINAEAYPVPIVFHKASGTVRRPTLKDLRWDEAALRAIPIALRGSLKPTGLGDYEPFETTVEVSTSSGPIKVDVKYPGGDLERLMRPGPGLDWRHSDLGDDEGEDDLPFYDRRGMEGFMQRAIAQQFGEQPGSGDPQLDQAQQIMYQAWDESHPGKRLTLAHKALSISPNCADAYVLLAEEEADTVGRALEYYQQGVDAGRRALGEAYFSEEVGHFWGLLETRPYMRALHGQANMLWQLRRHEEAAAIYREMLRLNPGDNQGVRYSLLQLLLELDRFEEARAVIAQYADEYSSTWLYTQALLAFQQEGDSPASTHALKEALKQNPHVPAYLSGQKRIPNRLPDTISPGTETEAIDYAVGHLNDWRRTPGAVEWITPHVVSSPPRKTARRPRQTRRK